ncbi:hypothetical protein EGT67_20115 [Prescottella agglutinans]|uniref:DUF3566 domain-containing protein n=1 Tax=Prescottella agglutinans TaxID=1644129 RepID=A0A3S3AT29_9NOCA|nr:DUF3566 domain-containing protein [Prescottella agglutinans]RVW07745.1 hypothetical protein EGT67_20115 [Prescottella agglutinans]
MSTPRKPGEQGEGVKGDNPVQEAVKAATAESVEAPASKAADAPKAADTAKAPEAPKAPESKDAKASQQSGGSADRTAAAAPADAVKGADPQKPAAQKPPQKPGAPTPPWQRGQQQGAPRNDANRPGAPAAGPAAGGQPPAAPGQPGTPAAAPGSNGAGKPPASARPVVTGTAAPKPPAPPAQPGTPAQHAQPGKPVVTGTAAPKPAGTAAPKPVVTGTAAPAPAQPGTPAPKPPAAKPPVPPAPGGAAGGGGDRRAAAKAAAQSKAAVLDGPTRSIARTDLAKDMPDLSEVKHPSPAPAPGGAASAPTGGALRKAASGALTATAPADGKGLRATVQLRRVDPWSTLKVSLVISIALFFVWMVAVGLLYVVLDGMGVWDRLNNAFTEIISDSNSGGLVTSGQVFGYSALVGLMNVVLFTALATIGSFIYNLCSDLVGGVQVTLADPD